MAAEYISEHYGGAVFLRIEAIIDNSDAKSESKRAFKKRIGSLLEIYQRRGGDLKTFLEAAKEGRLNEVARLEKGVKKAIKQALEEFRDELEEKK